MSSPQRADRAADSPERAVLSLRERKKAKTRRTIQEHALRLFAEQGYEATTVEQIAEAAEVSPSTFFRYFPTKEDLIIQDDYDPLLVAMVRAQPPELPPLAAIRQGIRTAFAQVPQSELEDVRARIGLMMKIPAVRARSLDNLVTTVDVLAGVVAERTGRDRAAPAVQTLAGAVVGAILPALFSWSAANGTRSLPDVVDEALGLLESGLPV
ncbi:TetR family transcriptional regulator [Microtetraspora sp. NBRC 16547]|uniref:acyl-CoA-like ligand-binding transcription factor n=1 Tax=Microtetraspora sp. NBRC 16547 TaxID=3030993 RepID=UPI0024A3F6A8|nr:TetR family transcriptional regulator [Microtetraspora sp. NBRC 16547]GLW97632.1 TetR family transcriptional regulator [Microtetraspora sp. NBRC 16547]